MTDYTISAQTETTRTLNINVDNGMNSLKESMLTFASNIEDGLSVKRDRVAQELEQFKRKINAAGGTETLSYLRNLRLYVLKTSPYEIRLRSIRGVTKNLKRRNRST